MAPEQNYSPAEKDRYLDSISFLAIPPIERIICAILMEDLKNLKDRAAVDATRWWWRMQRKYGEPHTWNSINGGYNVREYQIGRNLMFTYVCRERKELFYAAKERVLAANPTAKDRKWLSDWETNLAKHLGIPHLADTKDSGRATEKQHLYPSIGNEGMRRIPNRRSGPAGISQGHSRRIRSNPYDDDAHERPVSNSWEDTPGAMMSIALSMSPGKEMAVDGRRQPSLPVPKSAPMGPNSKTVTFGHPYNGHASSSTGTNSREIRTAPEPRPQDRISRGTQSDEPRTLGPKSSPSANKPLPPVLQASVEMGIHESQLRFLRQALEYCECQPTEIDAVTAVVSDALHKHKELRDM